MEDQKKNSNISNRTFWGAIALTCAYLLSGNRGINGQVAEPPIKVTETNSIVRTRGIEIVDAKGVVRAELLYKESKKATRLVFYNTKGEPNLFLGVNDKDKPELILYDINGNSRASVYLNNGDIPKIVVRGRGATEGNGSLSVDDEFGPVLQLGKNNQLYMLYSDGPDAGDAVKPPKPAVKKKP